MDHIYQNFNGWFTFPKFYRAMIDKFNDGAKLIEIGVYAGRSLSYLVVESLNAGKHFNITAIDGWVWPELLAEFEKNTEPIADKFTAIQSYSWEAADLFPNKSIDFVFIDADHTYESIVKDIAAWTPKVKEGGILSGHDYDNFLEHEGVKRAVTEAFGDRVHTDFADELVFWVQI